MVILTYNRRASDSVRQCIGQPKNIQNNSIEGRPTKNGVHANQQPVDSCT